ncbi:hypothetical protein J0J80_01525 [Turicibacter bilis]|uniref:hypothetical protein n=1 Tax=Turicibacter bilis TaxID=2735723 RepID=UPI001BAEA310|nr:hypothetical protein [Turicibacter bilis]MBS3203735.1 hypothetical protein [Turicibacter bilis]UUF11098.1 hypothetical protein J0J80_01525 [Turicibacter bilis]
MLIGKGILNGKVPYVDLFDHKGPILFFIEAFAQSIIPGRWGIFIFQIVNLFCCLLMIHKISMLFISSKKSVISTLAALGLLGLTLRNGNISEEYSLILLLIPIHLSLKYVLDNSKQHSWINAFIYGCCATTLFLIKMNAIIPIGFIILFILVDLIVKKEYKNIFINAIGFIGGFSIIILPVCIYFIGHEALYEMVYGTLLFNLKYMSKSTNSELPFIKLMAQQLMTLFPVIIPSFISVLIYNRNRNYKLISFIIILTLSFYFTINTGHRYIYYHVLNIIPFSLGVTLFLKYLENQSTIFIELVISLIFGLSFALYAVIGRDVFTKIKSEYYSTYNQSAQQLAEYIPENEKNSVLGYNTSSKWFLATDIFPCTRFYTNQDWWGIFDSIVFDEINSVLLNEVPKWIITNNLDGISNENIKQYIVENYVFVDKNEAGELYEQIYK